VHVIERLVGVEIPPATPKHTEWVGVLGELTRQLDTGAIYDRDLPAVTSALQTLLDAHQRRRR
jgi:hypothetical protein